jgi:ribosomal protein L22
MASQLSALPEPAIPLDSARDAAALLARFMAENASDFGLDVEFMFIKKITVPLSKMMISRFRQRVQGTLDSFLR